MSWGGQSSVTKSGIPGPKNPKSSATKTTTWHCSTILLGPAFGRTDFSRIFIFEPPDFFADFLAGFFLLIFVGKSAQKNPPGKSPGKSSKIYTTKILQHISADCPGQILGICHCQTLSQNILIANHGSSKFLEDSQHECL